jgi:hypothetical protein
MHKNIFQNLLLVLLTAIILIACYSGRPRKAFCVNILVFNDGVPEMVDSCFVAKTNDSSEIAISSTGLQRTERIKNLETKMLFIIVDTLQKKPNDYEYALVVVDASGSNPEVTFTSDASLVKAQSAPYTNESIIIKKVETGENIEALVEFILRTNMQINWIKDGKREARARSGNKNESRERI